MLVSEKSVGVLEVFWKCQENSLEHFFREVIFSKRRLSHRYFLTFFSKYWIAILQNTCNSRFHCLHCGCSKKIVHCSYSKFRKTLKDLLYLVATCEMQSMKLFFLSDFLKLVSKKSLIYISFIAFRAIANYSKFKNRVLASHSKFKNHILIWEADHTHWNFLKDVFHKFSLVHFAYFVPFTAKVQNICILIGREEHNIGCIVLLISTLYSSTKKQRSSISMHEKNRNLLIKMMAITNYRSKVIYYLIN